MVVINHKCFKGHETLPGQFVKISAYADDTAVHLGAMADIKIYCLLLCQYSLAIGGVTNFNKSEGVLCGAWRLSKPNMGISPSLLPTTHNQDFPNKQLDIRKHGLLSPSSHCFPPSKFGSRSSLAYICERE
jgi:hypothetical protein